MKNLLLCLLVLLASFAGFSQPCDVALALDDRPRLRRQIAEPVETSIYPNPVVSTLNVRLAEPSAIRLFSSVGQIVYSAKAGQSKTINVSHLAQGMYLLEVVNDKSRTVNKVFVGK